MLDLIGIFLGTTAIIRRKVAFTLFLINIYYYTFWFFGSSTSNFLFTHNCSDVGNLLCLMLVFILFHRKYRNGIKIKAIQTGVITFLLFFAFTLAIDITVNHTPFISIFKAIRQWIPLSLLFVCNRIKPKEGYLYFRYLIVFTLCFSTIYIFEYFTNISLTGAIRTMDGARASLPWPVALLCFSLLLFNRMGFSRIFVFVFLLILLTNLVFCGSRSFFISYMAIFALYYIGKRFSVKKLMTLAAATCALFVIFNTDNILSQRFNDSRSDIEGLREGDMEVNGNLSFRLLLTKERLDYVTSSWQYTLFGIGQIEEKNIKHEIFHIGLIRDDGMVYQVDTGDIAWPIAFLRWGILGTIIYLVFFYYRFFHYFFQRRNFFIARSIAYYLIVEISLVSFTYPEITFPWYWYPAIISLACFDYIPTPKKIVHYLLPRKQKSHTYGNE